MILLYACGMKYILEIQHLQKLYPAQIQFINFEAYKISGKSWKQYINYTENRNNAFSPEVLGLWLTFC